MAELVRKKTSALPLLAAGSITGKEFFSVGYQGNNYRVLLEELKKYIGVSGGGGGSVDLTSVLSDVVPFADNSYTLGAEGNHWKRVYVNDIDSDGDLTLSPGGNVLIPGSDLEVGGSIYMDGQLLSTRAYVDGMLSGKASADALSGLVGRVTTIEEDYLQSSHYDKLVGLINGKVGMGEIQGNYLSLRDGGIVSGDVDFRGELTIAGYIIGGSSSGLTLKTNGENALVYNILTDAVKYALKSDIPTTTDQIGEGKNLYFTNQRALDATNGTYLPIDGTAKGAETAGTASSAGYANSAGQATNDSAGNKIVDTYLKISEYNTDTANLATKDYVNTQGFLKDGNIRNLVIKNSGGAELIAYRPTTSGAELTLQASYVGLGNVENTKLSTWAGSANITALGTITSGTWNGTKIANAYLANNSITIAGTSIALGGSMTQNQLISLAGVAAVDAKFANYLPLAGGTLTGNLSIDNSSTDIYFRVRQSETSKACFGWESGVGAYLYNYSSYRYLGISDEGTPFYKTSSGINTLIHSGNYSDYALPLSGGTISGDLRLKQYLIINAWEGYGTGSCDAWYNGNNGTLYMSASNIRLGSSSSIVIHSGNISDYTLAKDSNGTVSLNGNLDIYNADSSIIIKDGAITSSTYGTTEWSIDIDGNGVFNSLKVGDSNVALASDLSGYLPLSGYGLLHFDARGRPVMDNNQGYSAFNNSGSAEEIIWLDTSNVVNVGGTTSKKVNIYTSLTINGNAAIHAGNIGSQSVANANKLGNINANHHVLRHVANLPYGKVLKVDVPSAANYLITIRGTNTDRQALVYVTGYGSGGTKDRISCRIITSNKNYSYYFNGASDSSCIYIKSIYTHSVDEVSIVSLGSYSIPTTTLLDTLPSNAVAADEDSNKMAVLSDTVAAANKLSTARTIWGQSFDGTGNVSGDLNLGSGAILSNNGHVMLSSNGYTLIGYGTAANGYRTYIDGNDIYMRYGKSHTTGLILNSSGNVTIGDSDLAGARWKAYINGSTRIADVTITSGVLNANRNVNSGALLDSSKMGFEIEPFASYVALKGYNTSGNGVVNINLSSSGNVGIGTTDPEQLLHVKNGNIYTNRYIMIGAWDGYGSGTAATWYNGSTSTLECSAPYLSLNGVPVLTQGALTSINDSLNNKANTADVIPWSATHNYASTVNPNVLTSPVSDRWYLVVKAAGNGNRLMVNVPWTGASAYLSGYLQKAGGTITGTLTIGNTSSSSITMSGNTVSSTGASNNWSVNNNAEAYFYTTTSRYFYGSLENSSDETLKNILGNVNLTANQIANAPAIYFTWKDTRKMGDEVHVGTTAQYWRYILPEVVHGEEGNLSVNYTELAVISSIVLARYVENHAMRIARLEEEIASMRENIVSMQEKLNALKAA